MHFHWLANVEAVAIARLRQLHQEERKLVISEREMDAAVVVDGLLAMVLYCHLDPFPQLDLALREVLVVGMSDIDAAAAAAAGEIDSWRPGQDVRVAHAHAWYAYLVHIHRHLAPNAGRDIFQQDVPNRVGGGSYYFAYVVVDHGCCEDALDLLPRPSSALRGGDDETAGREDDGDSDGDTEVACGCSHPSGPMRDGGGADGGPHSMHLCERMLPKM